MIRVTDTLAVDERALTESFIRASGPGGQNVNKVASAVQLRFELAASGLPDQVRTRLARLAGKRLTQAGEIIVTAQRHRTQERNRAAALETLLRLIRRAAAPPRKRVPTAPTAAARRRRLATKSHRGSLKQTRAAVTEES
ncbi:MAG TPA: alternative ribosome rescue aminoacyl-tRNA hydrolase ArfB [Acetobacteraceae bacterium]|nr:alternative ribosome rescue aminoacyl-tRNA hydrolase ArfB [Acetobacteraceae bacterium]